MERKQTDPYTVKPASVIQSTTNFTRYSCCSTLACFLMDIKWFLSRCNDRMLPVHCPGLCKLSCINSISLFSVSLLKSFYFFLLRREMRPMVLQAVNYKWVAWSSVTSTQRSKEFFLYFFLCSLTGSSLMSMLHIHHDHYIPHSCIINVTTNEMAQVMNN